MKEKCLVLNFKNAGLFIPKKFGDKHKMIENGKVSDRDGSDRFINVPLDTLLKEHVANVLSVLMGERPVPTVRMSSLAFDTSILNLADEAFVEIEEGIFKDKTGKIRVLDEVIATTKAISNSKKIETYQIHLKEKQTLKTITVSWEKIKWHLGHDLFELFKKMVVDVLGIESLEDNMVKVFEDLYKSKDKRIEEFCDLKGVLSPYRRMLVEGNALNQEFHFTGYTGFKHWHYNTLTHGLEKVAKLSGKIFIPMRDSDVERLNNGCGHATLLDGGLVTINDILPNSEILYLNANPVFKRS